MGEQDGELDVCLVSRSFLDSSVSTSRKRDEEHNSVAPATGRLVTLSS